MPISSSPFPAGSSVVAYLRDSGGDNQDLSIPQQENAIRTWCSQHNLTLTRIYRDESAPGSSVVGRKAFLQLVDDLTRSPQPECGVILWQFSRFSREFDDSQFYKATLRRAGYLIHSMQDNIPAGIDGRLFESIIDWTNARYLETLSIDVRRGLSHNLTQYGAVPGTPPRGFRRSAPIHLGQRRNGQPHIVHRWEPDPAYTERIQTAFQLRAQEKSYRTITAATHRLYTTDSSWNHFFANRLYIGELHYGGQVILNYCPPIIDRPTWDIVQEVNSRTIQQRTDKLAHPRRAASNYILSGLAVCALCGSPLNGETIHSKAKNHTNRYYGCSLKKRTHGTECTALLIPQAALEQAIIAQLSEHIYALSNLQNIRANLASRASQKPADLQQRTHELSRQLSTIRQKIANLITALEDGPSPHITTRLAELTAQEREILAEKARITESTQANPSQAPVERLAETIRAALQGLDPARLRELLPTLIHHVEAARQQNRITGTIYYYVPDEITSIELSHRRGPVYTHKFNV